MPDGPDELVTVDEIADLLRRVRDFMRAEGVPGEYQAEYAQIVVRPFLGSFQPLSNAERVDIRRKFSEALGFEISLPN